MVEHDAQADEAVQSEDQPERDELQEHVVGHGVQGVRPLHEAARAQGAQHSDPRRHVERAAHRVAQREQQEGEGDRAEGVEGEAAAEVVRPDRARVAVADDAVGVDEGGAGREGHVGPEEDGREDVEGHEPEPHGAAEQPPLGRRAAGAEGDVEGRQHELHAADDQPAEVPDLR